MAVARFACIQPGVSVARLGGPAVCLQALISTLSDILPSPPEVLLEPRNTRTRRHQLERGADVTPVHGRFDTGRHGSRLSGGQEVGSSNLLSPTTFASLTNGVRLTAKHPSIERVAVGRAGGHEAPGKWVVRQVGSDPRTGKRRVNQLATYDTKKAAAAHKQLIVDGRIRVSTETVAGFVQGSWLAGAAQAPICVGQPLGWATPTGVSALTRARLSRSLGRPGCPQPSPARGVGRDGSGQLLGFSGCRRTRRRIEPCDLGPRPPAARGSASSRTGRRRRPGPRRGSTTRLRRPRAPPRPRSAA